MKKKITIFTVLLTMSLMVQNSFALVFNATVPSGTKQCWLVGNFKLISNTTDWDAAFYKLNRIDDTHFTIDVPDAEIAAAGLDQTTILYKYLSGPNNWGYAEKDAAGADVNVRSYTSADVVASWGTIYDPQTFTIKILTPKTVSECYITGFYNAWVNPAQGTQMILDPKNTDPSTNLYYAKIKSTPDSMIYKFAAGPGWAYLQNTPNTDFTNIDSIPHTNVSFNRVLNYSTRKTVTLNVTVPVGTGNVYLMGSNVKWDGINWILGTKNSNGTFTFTIDNVDLMDYSYFNSSAWGYNEIASDGSQRFHSIDAQIGTTFNDVVFDWKSPVISGLNNVEKGNHNVRISNQSIIVDNILCKVEIFDLRGVKIEAHNLKGTYTSKKLNSGLYILRIDNKAEKVLLN